MTLHTPLVALARAVAQGAHPSDLLLELQRELRAAAGGDRSIILQPAGHSGSYSATSSHGFDETTGPWLSPADAAALESATAGGPRVCSRNELGVLADRLNASQALVVSLPGPRPSAFLIVTDPTTPAEQTIDMASAARNDFILALELARLAREAALHRRIQELLLGFSRGISGRLGLSGALESLAKETNVLFGTRRVSVWLHNRRARALVLAASSDATYAASRADVDAGSDAAAAQGLRLDRPRIEQGNGDTVLIAPLRGWRRALGTLIIEGEPAGLDDQQRIDATYELGRQLSVAMENVQLLEEFLQQRRLLEDTFNSLVDLVVVTDNASRIVQMNGAFASRVGRPAPDLLGRPLADLIGSELAEWTAFSPLAPRNIAGSEPSPGAARTGRFTDERLDGTFAATVTPLISQSGLPAGRVLVARDITAQTGLEREREALRDRLAQSERLASLGQFVAGIAHEMNNPLQGVLGHLELLIKTSEAARPVRPTLRRIYQEGDRAAKIVRNLLVFAGSRRMSRRRLTLDRVLSRALASRAAARKRARIELTRHQAEGVPGIAGDALLLQQALLNILINAEHAVMATAAPGRIETTIARSTDGLSAILSIRDTGPGIPPDVLPRVFDPFFTTKEVGRGTGLGLAITYGIVQEHGGTIQAANHPSGGAQFTIELPAAPSPAAGPGQQTRKPKPEGAEPARITRDAGRPRV